MEDAAADETDTATAAEELQQCSDWLLRIEENLRDSSLTFQALRWALSSLRSSSQKPKKKKQTKLRAACSLASFFLLLNWFFPPKKKKSFTSGGSVSQ